MTAVCGTNDVGTRIIESEFGANLWVCAPAGDYENAQLGMVTTENYDRYVYGLRGTSVSTAIVSGVAALMRDANLNLTWRDLKLILASSARKNDPTNPGWEDGARKYGSASATDRYQFNHEYGFGVVDAKAAVDMAKGWGSNVPALQTSTVASGSFNFPDSRPASNRHSRHVLSRADHEHRRHRLHRGRRGQCDIQSRIVPRSGHRAGVSIRGRFETFRSFQHLHTG